MCLEVIVTLAETAPAMMRKKSSKYITQLIGQVLEVMADVEDDDDWSTQDDPDGIDKERYYYFYWKFIPYRAF
jgi:importin-5